MKNIRLYTLLALLLMAREVVAQNNCWDGSVAEVYAGGDGTPENPYQIATAEQLALLAQQTNDGMGGDACYILTDNICLNENPDVNPLLWTPIGHVVGNEPPYFTGRFDGNKMHISGLVCHTSSGHGISGLFGCTYGAVIQNVTLQNCRLSGTQYAGALVGYAGLTNITQCHVDEASVSCENGAAGGLVGLFGLPYGMSQSATDTCRIEDCSVERGVTIYGRFSGGLAGLVNEYASGPSVPCVVSNCTGNAILEGSRYVGGLVGFFRDGKMELCRCWNEVHSGQYAGGMVGMGATLDFYHCQNGVSVTGNYHCGGMAGFMCGGDVVNCENYGTIHGAGTASISEVGGIVGRYEPDPILVGTSCENKIFNCHNFGEVTKSNTAGGIVGFAEGCGVETLFILECSNRGTIYENSAAGGILGGCNRYIMKVLNVYNRGAVGARVMVGGIVGDLAFGRTEVMNVYNTGELTHEIDNYLCPRGSIVGSTSSLESFSDCYWLANDEYGGHGQSPELPLSSAFQPTSQPSVWQLDIPLHGTDDLLSALNAGVDDIESSFPQLGMVSRWREDVEHSNDGFPLFGNQWPNGVDEPIMMEKPFNVFPNPTNGVLYLEMRHGTSLQNQTYRITSLMGQTLQTGHIVSDNQPLDVSTLPAGMYLFTMDGTTMKFVVN